MRLVSVARIVVCSTCSALGILLASVMPPGWDGTTFVPGPTGRQPGGTAAPEAGACVETPACIDGYLWAVYQRTPKVDGGGDFTWKDSDAADKTGMALMNYVIGGMDPWFRVTLYRALRTLDLVGFRPGITCGFRDDYRQSITSGRMKASSDRSFHGGSFRGGYGHGMAADIVSVNGATTMQRSEASERMWEWIDHHEAELGIGRPYLRRDPPHVAPLDGEEYAVHRTLNARGAAARRQSAQEP